MGSGRCQDQHISVAGEQFRETVVLSPGVRDIVGLVDDDGVPLLSAQMRNVLVRLESVDRDDHSLVVSEGIAARRESLADPLDAERIQPHEWERETVPKLGLHLLQNMLRGDYKDSFTTTTAHEFAEDHTDLDRLAEADRICEEQPRARNGRIENLLHSGPLVREWVNESGVGSDQILHTHWHRRATNERRELVNRGDLSATTLVLASARSSPVENRAS